MMYGNRGGVHSDFPYRLPHGVNAASQLRGPVSFGNGNCWSGLKPLPLFDAIPTTGIASNDVCYCYSPFNWFSFGGGLGEPFLFLKERVPPALLFFVKPIVLLCGVWYNEGEKSNPHMEVKKL